MAKKTRNKSKQARAAAKKERSRKNLECLNRQIAERDDLRNMPRDQAVVTIAREAQIRTLRDYNRKLRSNGIAMEEALLDSLNVIDMRGCELLSQLRNPETGPEARKLLETDNIELEFYRYVPCFTEGILRTDVLGDLEVYFKIKSLDVKNKSTDLLIQAYQYQDGAGRLLLRSEEIGILFDAKSDDIVIREDDVFDRYAICRMLPVNDMDWSEVDRSIWKSGLKIFKNPERQESKLYTEFVGSISVANYIMELARDPRSDQTTDGDAGHVRKEKHKAKTGTHGTPGQVTHVYDGLKIIYKARQYNVSKNGRNYVTPVWTVKGHVRKYKSGKVVYVPPAVKHRKSLLEKQPDADAPKSVIKIE